MREEIFIFFGRIIRARNLKEISSLGLESEICNLNYSCASASIHCWMSNVLNAFSRRRNAVLRGSTGVPVIGDLSDTRVRPSSMGVSYASSLFVVLAVLVITVKGGDIIRKSIVFDKNTPDVFYCPPHKPTGFEKMIVKAKPLWRLCQFEGRPIPEDYKSDCYNDVDESEYACKEKYRIMKRIKNAEGDAQAIDNHYIEK